MKSFLPVSVTNPTVAVSYTHLFFVLCIKGDSMYPQYQDGDKVLILRQSTVNYSGDVGAVIYLSLIHI